MTPATLAREPSAPLGMVDAEGLPVPVPVPDREPEVAVPPLPAEPEDIGVPLPVPVEALEPLAVAPPVVAEKLPCTFEEPMRGVWVSIVRGGRQTTRYCPSQWEQWRWRRKSPPAPS